jgi:hypothetical protein
MFTHAVRRVVVALLVLLVVQPLAPAQADEVSRAEDQVAQLQAQVAATTRKLQEGTRRWERDRAALGATQAKLTKSRAAVAAAEAQMAEGARRVGVVARRLYMSPGSTTLLTAPDEVLERMRAEESLTRAGQSDAQVILEARTARSRLVRQQRDVEALVQDARDLERRSAQQLRELNELADTMAAHLIAAEQGLVGARNRKAARVAAARAARARALAMLGGGSGAFCTKRSTAGMANGNLDPAALCPLWRAPGHRLAHGAAGAFNKMSQYYASTHGGAALCVTDSYRSYAEQVDVYHRKPGLAAVPGTSNHGWGMAVDFCGGVQTFGTPAHTWMKANARRFGWFHPSWAEPSGSKPEAWHWEYSG